MSGGRSDNPENFGAVLVFKPHIPKEQAQRILSELVQRGLIEDTRVNSFNPEWGGPVWYVP